VDLNPVAQYSVSYEGTLAYRKPKGVITKKKKSSTGGISPGTIK
jgi:hypothetical protein